MGSVRFRVQTMGRRHCLRRPAFVPARTPRGTRSHGLAFRLRRRSRAALRPNARPESVSNRELAEAYHLSRHTVAKWRRREGTEDASHRPQRLHATLTPSRRRWWSSCTRHWLLPLDDLLAVTHKFIHPAVSRPGLEALSAPPRGFYLKALMPQEEGTKTPVKTFKAMRQALCTSMPDQEQRRYLFVAIDRETRWVQAMKNWYQKQPNLFKKRVYNLAGLDR